ncbi:hypothetical protein R5R35_006602 [Gryllus longicercus]
MLALALATGAVALLALLLLRGRGGVWAKLHVPWEPGLPLVGNYGRVLLQTAAIQNIYRDIYRKHPDKPFVGIYKFRKPALLVRDPDLAKNILTRDFSSFHDNALDVDSKLDPLLALNPFFLRGEQWKRTRAQLVPAFSSGRLRQLLQPIHDVTRELISYVRAESPAALPDGLDVKELAAKFTTEVVSSVAFGVRANSFRDPDAEIRRMGRRIMQADAWNNFLFTISFFLPTLRGLLRVSFMPKEVDRFFRKLVGEAVRHREETGVERNDFLQLLLGLKQKAQEQGDEYGNEEITAHAITFFSDGFETSSVALSFLLHDLAGSAAAQRRLREELGRLPADDHEAVLRMPFLDACLMESLRLHPPAGFLEKRCTSAYALALPGGGTAQLPAGVDVVLPVLAWHSDPALFPDPHAFRPERFLEEGGAGPRGAFVPFGDGPRQCIGMRFAQMQVKMGAAALVRAFELRRTPRSPADPVQQDPKNFLAAALGGLWLHFEPVDAAAA